MRTARIVGQAVVSWLVLGATAHASVINYSTKEIRSKIVYFATRDSTAATDNLSYIYRKTNPDAKGKMIALATADKDTQYFDFLPLSLGEIRGFKVHFDLYTVPTGKDYRASRLLLLKGADGVVFVADADPARAAANAAALAELKQDLAELGYDYAKLPVVIELVATTKTTATGRARAIKALASGDEPTFEVELASGAGVFDTLKAVAKLVLTELRKGSSDDAATTPPVAPKTRAR